MEMRCWKHAVIHMHFLFVSDLRFIPCIPYPLMGYLCLEKQLLFAQDPVSPMQGLLKRGQPRAQRVPLWALAGNWPLLLCFGRWGAPSRDPFWPTTPPQQLPQPSCSLRYVLSAPGEYSSDTDHWEMTHLLCGNTLRILLINLCTWHILAVQF